MFPRMFLFLQTSIEDRLRCEDRSMRKIIQSCAAVVSPLLTIKYNCPFSKVFPRVLFLVVVIRWVFYAKLVNHKHCFPRGWAGVVFTCLLQSNTLEKETNNRINFLIVIFREQPRSRSRENKWIIQIQEKRNFSSKKKKIFLIDSKDLRGR